MKPTILLTLALALLAGCSTSVTSPAGDASSPDSSDAAGDAGGDDTGITGCMVDTCAGKVFVPLGSKISNGDNCGDTCSCQGGGGLIGGGCTYTVGCECLDAGGD